ncbi:MAG: hypothetical protein ACE5GF_09535, partial [Thermodesulfobacteriota bacterium]
FHKETKEFLVFFWVLVAIILNSVVAFFYTLATTTDPTTLWSLVAVNFVYYLGIAQSGIVFSAIMRIAKSEWGRYFSRLGEILTLSSIPWAFILFLLIYFGGTDLLFYWAQPVAAHVEIGAFHHDSPWLDKEFFFWRAVITMALFYGMSYLYFRLARIEESKKSVGYDLEKRLNLYAGFVMFFYVVTNTNLAWDFGMMIIPHWESVIFPAYFWVGNLFACAAFLYLLSLIFLSPRTHEGDERTLVVRIVMEKTNLHSMATLLMGFTLLWVYMFWAQHIVTWYGDRPVLTEPLFWQMEGYFTWIFAAMIMGLFIVPFLALLTKRVKLALSSMAVVSLLICVGIWLNRYLMIVPVYTDGSESIVANWTGISLVFGGLAGTLLALIIFIKIFPYVSLIQEE